MLSEKELAALNDLLSLVDVATPAALRAASTLGVPDAFRGETADLESLRAETGVASAKMPYLLDALVRTGVLVERERSVYGLTARGALLRTDHAWSMRDAFALADTEIAAWSELEHAVRTCGSGFEKAFGESHRQYRARHAEEDIRMDRMHQAASRVDLYTLTRAYPWGAFRRIADIGGGTGTFLGGILKQCPALQGTLFDLERMLERAPEVLARYGVHDRCRILPGDFFRDIPGDHDLYVLKAVLGGWDDDACIRILTGIRHAMPPGSRLLVIEPLMGAGSAYARGNLVQLHLLVLYGGRYRGVDEYREMASRAGLHVSRVIPRSTMPIVEMEISEGC
ncbi:MAG: methyltransferase [Pseudomonadota bacterium]